MTPRARNKCIFKSGTKTFIYICIHFLILQTLQWWLFYHILNLHFNSRTIQHQLGRGDEDINTYNCIVLYLCISMIKIYTHTRVYVCVSAKQNPYENHLTSSTYNDNHVTLNKHTHTIHNDSTFFLRLPLFALSSLLASPVPVT